MWGNPSGFESRVAHHKKSAVSNSWRGRCTGMSATRSANGDTTTLPTGTASAGHSGLPGVTLSAHAPHRVKLQIAVCVFAAALLAACGSIPAARSGASAQPTIQASPGTTALPTAQASPSANPTPSKALFAVVETGPNLDQPDTVAIVDFNGNVRAKASFQPRVGPRVPDAYTPLQSVAQKACRSTVMVTCK